MTHKKVIVFFARDFLSDWFSDVGVRLDGFERLYIVVSEEEAKKVGENDSDGKIFNLSDTKYSGSKLEYSSELLGFNRDRFLRFESGDKIKSSIGPCIQVAQEIISNYDVFLYVDEPIANFPNEYLNMTFRSVGAQCLHFQTSWVAGYGFFCSDAAQAEPFRLDGISNGDEVISNHVKQRQAGKGQPLYVLSYDRFHQRLFDGIKFFVKGVIKMVTRRAVYYVRQSQSSDFFHARCLLSSFTWCYDNIELLEASKTKFVIYPLHYEPEAVLTYMSKSHTRQSEVVAQIIDSLPVGYEIILKEHPSQPGALNTSVWRDVIRCKRVHKVFATKKCDAILKLPGTVVVSFGSTMVLDAILSGARCAVFGDVHFANAPGVVKIDNIADWGRCLYGSDVPSCDLMNWYSSFLEKYCFDDIPMSGRATNGSFEKVIREL
jgi:hypothetical protein